jgi:hypothetical protein
MQFDSLDDIRAFCRGLPAGNVDANEFLTAIDGAVVAILLLRAALACHAGTTTFSEAGVSGAGTRRNLVSRPAAD